MTAYLDTYSADTPKRKFDSELFAEYVSDQLNKKAQAYDSEHDQFGVDFSKKELDALANAFGYDERKDAVEKARTSRSGKKYRVVTRAYTPESIVGSGIYSKDQLAEIGGNRAISKLLVTLALKRGLSRDKVDKAFRNAFDDMNQPVQVLLDKPDIMTRDPEEVQFFFAGKNPWGRDFTYAGEGPGQYMLPTVHYDSHTKEELKKLIRKTIGEWKAHGLDTSDDERSLDRLDKMALAKDASSRRKETYESGEGEVESYTPDKTEDHDEIVLRLKDGRRIRISNNTRLGKLLKARVGSRVGYHGYRVDGTDVVHKVHPNAHSRGGWLEEKAASAMSRDRIQPQYARHPQESLERLAERLARKKWEKRDVAREDAAHAEEFGITGEDKEYLDRYIIARIAERYDRKAKLKQALMRALLENGHNGESFDAAIPARMTRFRQYEGSPFGKYDNPVEQAKYDEWASKSDKDMDVEWEKYLKS